MADVFILKFLKLGGQLTTKIKNKPKSQVKNICILNKLQDQKPLHNINEYTQYKLSRKTDNVPQFIHVATNPTDHSDGCLAILLEGKGKWKEALT